MTMRDEKSLKDLLAMDNESLDSIAPKPFKPCSLSVILSALTPNCYSQDQLAEIKNFCEQIGVDSMAVNAERRSPQEEEEESVVINNTRRVNSKRPRSKRIKRVAATKKSKKNAPPLPMEFKNKIKELDGTNIAFIMHKTICATDTAKNNNRLSMPLSQVECDFLTKAENEALDERGIGKHLIGLEVRVLDPCLREWKTLKLKKWDMKTTCTYNLAVDWNNLCGSNDLQVGDELNLWTFRVQDKRYIMLHRLLKI